MKKLIKCAGRRCLRMSFLLLSVVTFSGLFSPPVFGNNIRVDGKTRVIGFSGDTAVIEVYLRWDNSWRDDFNWDAAWVFFKYKKRGLANPWQHAYLSSSGHVLSASAGNEGGGYSFMVGANGGKVNGLYVMRNSISEGNVSMRLQAKWPLAGTGLTKSDFGEALNEIYVAVHAIEMVYIPYGAYYLGDAYSNKSFAVGGTEAVVIDTEAAMTLSAKDGMANVSLSASYPKGYVGFYIMKYETSQEQYVEFLNSLTLEQQQARVMNNDFAHMKRGDYVFGDPHTPSCRNGIVFIEQRQPNTPVVFGNNLNPNNDLFSTDDGQTLACNYMSVEDMIAYCSWSGLRPMSELEYEKACRRFYPQVPDKGEYAWNTNNGINRLSSLSDLNFRGDEREQANNISKNVNSGTSNSINGPVRCGMFGTSATNQSQSGATYWAVMEMSGNLKELCANVNYTNLDGGSCGAGVYNANLWDKTATRYGVRGGGFNSADDLLRTSDRTEAMNYFTAITQRDSTVGFRGVYNLSGIKIDGGEIKMSQDTACWGETDVLNITEASCPDFPDVRFQYNWYVKKPGEAKFDIIPNAGGATLKYEHFENKTTAPVVYTFKRTGICAMGVAESNEVMVTVLPEPFVASSYTFNPCPVAIPHRWNGLNYTWRMAGVPGVSFVDDNKQVYVNGIATNGNYTLEVQWEQCPDVFSVAVEAKNIFAPTGATIFAYTGAMQCVVLPAGKYQIECWGAQGGSYGGTGGKGGYTTGEINLTAQNILYIYVGQQGYANTSNYTFNGGGIPSNQYNARGGGGASDVRLVGADWDNFNSLKSRLMVAAGGGGSDYYQSRGSNGGAGGGLAGNNGGYYRSGGSYPYAAATGGTQTAGGISFYGGNGSFGLGGCQALNHGGGGGSGYYGGANGGHNSSVVGAGAGGSSFISGHTGCNAIDAASTATNIIHTGLPYHYSGLFFTNTSTTAGANSGHGQVRITPLN
ncbi:glycine-rich protein [Odoribacter lunatus]|uniref:glycine-rich protein n=1 Tax=Odoribacter lunatus TaxID=2941335 RepID=UPI00203E914F|nr:glycine-rich protein [Odoribacter lunatus]